MNYIEHESEKQKKETAERYHTNYLKTDQNDTFKQIEAQKKKVAELQIQQDKVMEETQMKTEIMANQMQDPYEAKKESIQRP